jgi:hypothetical protein
MSDVSAMTLAVLRRFAEFLEALPEDQVADLAEGRAQLSYIPFGADAPVAPKPSRKPAPKKGATPKVDPLSMVQVLERATSRDEGRGLLEPLAVGDVRAVATAAGMTGVSRTPKPDLVEQIVGLLIGGRLTFAAIRGQ